MDILEMHVADDDPYDDLDKTISKFKLDGISEKKLSLTVLFNDLTAISKDVTEPDMLSVKFLKPNLFIDEETGLTLDRSSWNQNVELKQ